jgi:hypothetical protein
MERIEKSLSPFKKDLGEPFAEGSHTDVFHYEKTSSGIPYVIKQGKTKYSFPFSKYLNNFLALNRVTVSHYFEKILGPGFKINPDFDYVKNGVAEYVLMSSYFRYGENSESQEKRKELIASLEDKNHPFYQEIKKILGDDGSVLEVANIVEKNREENFMPGEIGTVIGHPQDLDPKEAADLQAKGEKLPSTYYIVQEEVKGDNLVPLLELNEKDLADKPEILERLLMFTVLTKMMYSGKDGKLIDTRAEEILKHPFEWFQETANILVDIGSDKKQGRVHFVDNRWLYDKKSRIGEGGINLIKHLCVRSIDRAIKKYYDLLQSRKARQ